MQTNLSCRQRAGISSARMSELIKEYITEMSKDADNIDVLDIVKHIGSMTNWSESEKIIMAYYLGIAHYKSMSEITTAMIAKELA